MHATYFNPRTSCEVRRKMEFDQDKFMIISIHAPRVRCDLGINDRTFYKKIFQSTHLV